MSRRHLRTGKRRARNRPHRITSEAMPPTISVRYDNFAAAYHVEDSREDVPRESSPRAIDMEVTLNNRLKRTPGTTFDENLAPHAPEQMALHTSLDFRSELVLFAPPFIGVKYGGAIVWTDVSLPVTGKRFAWTNFGGTLIFANGGEQVFARQPQEASVTEIEDAPSANAYATFAGRVVAGGAVIDGRYEPLGVAWSAADSNYEHWDRSLFPSSGFELLIDKMTTAADRIISLDPMGLDFMAIVNRRSIWLGRRTGLPNRPIDFQTRVPGVGAITKDVVVTSRRGVLFLSDNGVYMFDGNEAIHVSKQIDPDLLPIDFDNIHLYNAAYDPRTKRYYLFTPTETWILDIEYARWYRRTLTARFGSIFATQIPGKTWGELVGEWGDQTETWSEFGGRETDDVKMYFLGAPGGVYQLVHEDAASETLYGTQIVPEWEFKLDQGQPVNLLLTINNLLLEYEGEGEVGLWLPDNDSQFEEVLTQELDAAAFPQLYEFPLQHTGKGIGARLKIIGGDPEILMMELQGMPRSSRIITAPAVPAVYTPDYPNS